MLTKYTVLDEKRREAKEEKSQRQNPRSISRGASYYRSHPNSTSINWDAVLEF